METMLSLLSIDTVFFTFLDYSMSYLELTGTVFYLWSVWLIARKNMLTWPVGIISVILYAFLFYQIQLYSDAVEQIYYLGMSIYGWIFWKKSAVSEDENQQFRMSPVSVIIGWGITALFLTAGVTLFMKNIHILLPSLFPLPASFPFLDALTTIMSFTAMFLMAQKRIESWVYWIIVDIIGIVLYYVKEVKFISLLYVILLCLAVKGLTDWRRDERIAEFQLEAER